MQVAVITGSPKLPPFTCSARLVERRRIIRVYGLERSMPDQCVCP